MSLEGRHCSAPKPPATSMALMCPNVSVDVIVTKGAQGTITTPFIEPNNM